jgi:hypothetical protein
MPGGLGPRFVVEAGFLILLAVGTGLADLAPRTIIIVMAAAWLLVALLEWLAWRDRVLYHDELERWRAERGVPPVEPYARRAPGPEALTSVVPPAARPGRRRLAGLRRGPPGGAGEETQA